jgi:hypothetical protein
MTFSAQNPIQGTVHGQQDQFSDLAVGPSSRQGGATIWTIGSERCVKAFSYEGNHEQTLILFRIS